MLVALDGTSSKSSTLGVKRLKVHHFLYPICTCYASNPLVDPLLQILSTCAPHKSKQEFEKKQRINVLQDLIRLLDLVIE